MPSTSGSAPGYHAWVKRLFRTPEVLVLGEVLCDLFAPRPGTFLSQADCFVPHPGGAPANVAVQLARLGVTVGLLSAVGADPLGERLIRGLADEGVDVSNVHVRTHYRTGLTLVEVDGDGERRFFGFRENSADLSFNIRDIDHQRVRRAAIVHTGTVSLRRPASRAATHAFIAAGRLAGAIVSLDVNLRYGMFPSRALLLRLARAAIPRADVVKATRQEALDLLQATPRTSNTTLVHRLLERGPSLVLLTLDDDGAVLASRVAQVEVPARRCRVVDSTGAGDAFVGAALARLIAGGINATSLPGLGKDVLTDVGREACRAGGAAITAVGATTAMVRAFAHPVRRNRRTG